MKLTKKHLRNLKTITKNFETGEERIENGILETKNGNLSTFSYLHGGVDFSQQAFRLSRGLTLDENDNVILCGFEKFFLENQLDTRTEYTEQFKEEFTRLQKQDEYEAIEKLDGTSIILGLYKDAFLTSTTSATTSKHAINALKYFNQLDNKEEIKRYLKDKNVCLIFEWISKFNRIAVDYETESEYILLAEVNKDNFKLTKYSEMENNLNFKGPNIKYYTYEELQDIKINGQNIEGFVVYNKYGRLIKFKTEWWFEEHFVNLVFFNDRLISKKEINFLLDIIRNDNIDELYARQNSNELWKKVDKVGMIYNIYQQLLQECIHYNNIYKTPREIAESDISKTLKGFVINYNKYKDILGNKNAPVRKYIISKLKLTEQYIGQ